MFCSHCGASLADGSQFCVECGHTIEAVPSAAAPAEKAVCPKCSKQIFEGARFCPFCGNRTPVPKTITVGEGGSAAAATPAADVAHRTRRSGSGKLLAWLGVFLALGAAGWVATTSPAIAPQIKSLLITAHSENITDTSIAVKPHGFASLKVIVPQGAVDIAITGQFDARGRNDNNIEVYLLNDGEFVIWQGGYMSSPYYDSGKVSHGNIQASLPSQAGTYYLVFSNKDSRVEKTVHVAAGLRYDTWFADSLITVKDKVVGWFE